MNKLVSAGKGALAKKRISSEQQQSNPGREQQSLSEQLEKLSALHSSGALSDSEFLDAKSKLLND